MSLHSYPTFILPSFVTHFIPFSVLFSLICLSLIVPPFLILNSCILFLVSCFAIDFILIIHCAPVPLRSLPLLFCSMYSFPYLSHPFPSSCPYSLVYSFLFRHLFQALSPWACIFCTHLCVLLYFILNCWSIIFLIQFIHSVIALSPFILYILFYNFPYPFIRSVILPTDNFTRFCSPFISSHSSILASFFTLYIALFSNNLIPSIPFVLMH